MVQNETSEDMSRKEPPVKRARATARRRAPRKTSVKKSIPTAPVEQTEERVTTPGRKAPTQIAARKASSKSRRNQLLVIIIISIVSIGSSAAIGFSDKGTIDVNQAIEDRNERLRNGQSNINDGDRIILPTQNTDANKLPDGGLVGLGIGAEPPKTAAELTETASSSTASTTNEIALTMEDGSTTTDSEATEEIVETENTTESEILDESVSVEEPSAGR